VKIVSVKPVIACKNVHAAFIDDCCVRMPRRRRVACALDFFPSVRDSIELIKIIDSIVPIITSVDVN
jgi:hypothetical protein